MSNIIYDYTEEYIRGLLCTEDELLYEMEQYAKENNVPIIHKEAANLLSLLIRLKNVNTILEVGTAIGYSAITMRKASQCKILTIEKDEEMIEKAKINIERANFSKDITIIKGDALEVLKNMDYRFDMIFLDAAKGQYLDFFVDCDRMLNKNGILFADNVLFRGMVVNDELLIRRKITIVKRMRKFLRFMSSNIGYQTSILPISDGVMISLKTGGINNKC